MERHRHDQGSLQFSYPGLGKRSEERAQRVGEVTSLSVFQLVDCGHQRSVIEIGCPRNVIGGPLPDAIFTDAILLYPVREGPPAQGANGGLDLREALEAGPAKGKVLTGN